MSIERKVQLVEELFYQLEQETVQFDKSSGLSCVAGCGKCCATPKIEASPLEFLPWAFHLFLNGETEAMLVKLKANNNSTCAIFKPLSVIDKGSCSNYKYRGLICRLFGNSANTDKYGALRMVTCKTIKEGQSNMYNSTLQNINNDLSIPIFTNYYMKLNQIDYSLGKLIIPVNQALKMAIEVVLQYYAYRPLPLINGQAV